MNALRQVSFAFFQAIDVSRYAPSSCLAGWLIGQLAFVGHKKGLNFEGVVGRPLTTRTGPGSTSIHEPD